MPTAQANAPDTQDLNPQFGSQLESLLAAVRKAGGSPIVTSGYRSYDKQKALYDSGNGGVPVAKPGTSLHEKGLAADVTGDSKTTQLLHSLAPTYGLAFPMSNDPVHVQPVDVTKFDTTSGPAGQADATATPTGPMPLKDRLEALANMFGTGATPPATGGSAAASTAGQASTGPTAAPATGTPGASTGLSTSSTTNQDITTAGDTDTGSAEGTPVAASGGAVGKDFTSNQQLGQQLASQFGWHDGDAWTALNNIITHESGWNPNAANPTSDARGIGQNIHGYSNDYQAGNAKQQIQWTYNYIAKRYGTPQAAWAHWQANNWY